jgi:hypothetical protein
VIRNVQEYRHEACKIIYSSEFLLYLCNYVVTHLPGKMFSLALYYSLRPKLIGTATRKYIFPLDYLPSIVFAMKLFILLDEILHVLSYVGECFLYIHSCVSVLILFPTCKIYFPPSCDSNLPLVISFVVLRVPSVLFRIVVEDYQIELCAWSPWTM